MVEDDADLAAVVKLNLERHGYVVDLAGSGAGGLGMAVAGSYDLLLLDVKLPDLDGTQICQKLRGLGVGLPILMLTSKKAEPDKLLGFQCGADDYVTKPFSMPELLARIGALLRRAKRCASDSLEEKSLGTIAAADLSINLDKRGVSVGGRAVEFTATEFDLLAFLAAHPGRAFSRDELLRKVWGYEFSGYESTVNVHINRVRSKIEKDPSHPDFILTVWGVGYRFAEVQELQHLIQTRAAPC
jgi:DNA-binding response OmpR family regulator